MGPSSRTLAPQQAPPLALAAQALSRPARWDDDEAQFCLNTPNAAPSAQGHLSACIRVRGCWLGALPFWNAQVPPRAPLPGQSPRVPVVADVAFTRAIHVP
jgi:hypothetical protein